MGFIYSMQFVSLLRIYIIQLYATLWCTQNEATRMLNVKLIFFSIFFSDGTSNPSFTISSLRIRKGKKMFLFTIT